MNPTDLFWFFLIFIALQPMLRQKALEFSRRRLIAKLEQQRQSRVILLVHRQETMGLLGFPIFRYIDVNDSEEVIRAIHLTDPETPLDLILHTLGGLVLASLQIARAINKHPAKVTVLVPHYAMSGGTLIALAADEIVMCDHAVLGPVDPQVGQMPAASLLRAVAKKPIEHLEDKTQILADQAEMVVCFSGGTVAVPVELSAFSGYASNGKVFLNWSTATETNNQGFEIERTRLRSPNYAEAGWEKIGFVPGFGTTTEPKSYSFIDENLNSGKYSYRLKQINYNGAFEYSNIVEIEVATPSQYSLEQNYPNPFNPVTTISCSIKEKGIVTLKVFDILGKEIATLVNNEQVAGSYKIEYDASLLASGIYFYSLKAGNFVSTKKMILLLK